MSPAGQELRIRILAGMAPARGRSEALSRLLETAAEEARSASHASGVSVSRLEEVNDTLGHVAGDRLCRHTLRSGRGAGISCGAASAVVTAEATFTPSDLFAAADRAQHVAKRGRHSSTLLADDFPPVVPG